MRLNHYTAARRVQIRLELFKFCKQKNEIQEFPDISALLRRNSNKGDFAAPFFNIYIMSGEFFFYLLGIGLRFINFVQRYKKWDIGFSNSVQRLKRLGFHAFISSDHKNCNISNPG